MAISPISHCTNPVSAMPFAILPIVEAVAGVAAGVVFVLREGVGVAITEVDSDIAVIARELGGK